MEFIKNLHENDFGELEGDVYFKYFDKIIQVEIEEGVQEPYVHKQIDYLNSISDSLISDICKFSFMFCKDEIKAYPDKKYPEGLTEINKVEDVLNYMSIEKIRIELCEEENENIKVLNLSGYCDWDEENGIQWIIKDDAVVYVGKWDDLSIWYSNMDSTITNYVLRG